MSIERIARATVKIEGAYICGWAGAAGKKEGEGPLGSQIDRVFDDNLLGEDSWEKAESRLLYEAVSLCCDNSGVQPSNVDVMYTGDLLNQCIASTFGLRGLRIPHIGMYGACSTMASTLMNAAIAVGSGAANHAIAATSSHFSSSERQFRTPLQYGGQRPPTAQWTVTGAGSVCLCADRDSARAHITAATAGIIEDLGITDANNMGAAMAPVDVILAP